MRKKNRGKDAKAEKHDDGAGLPPTRPKGLRGSKAGLALSLGSSALAVTRSIKQARKVHGTHDKLRMADAVAGAVPVVTSAALIARELRRATRKGKGADGRPAAA
ncbi:hypothetical protein [Streptomyces sp. NPDC060194]|uniref:hypothetical protein n=1 Tax=Streptomyces sp. NPDC060194 TaxID=3347069 RepID=UPI00364BE7D6